MSDAAIIALISLVGMALGFWNQNRMAERNRRWDVEDRAVRHAETISAVSGVGEKADSAYHEANNVNIKIEDLNKANADMSKEIKAVLAVVKHTTGEHKPLSERGANG